MDGLFCANPPIFILYFLLETKTHCVYNKSKISRKSFIISWRICRKFQSVTYVKCLANKVEKLYNEREVGNVEVYHGTFLEAAKSIEEDGVLLRKCKQHTDFGKEFYVTEYYEYALNTAKKKVRKSFAKALEVVNKSFVVKMLIDDGDAEWQMHQPLDATVEEIFCEYKGVPTI